MNNPMFSLNDIVAPANPNASVYHAAPISGAVRTDTELTVRNDAGSVLWRGFCPGTAKLFMKERDPSGWELRCFTVCGRPVSLLNV